MPSLLETKSIRDDYVAVSVSMLRPSKLCGVSLYVRDGRPGAMRLFRGPNLPISQQTLDELVASGNRKLYVASGEFDRFQQFLRDNLDDALCDATIGVTQQFEILNVVVRDVLSDVFRKGNVDQSVAKAVELGESTVGLLCREGAMASELCGVMYHDYQTFTHSANVAYYCVLLAKELGISAADELNKIATGALLHDLGKLDIPERILNKPGKLSDAEFGIIKAHPGNGFRLLCQRKDLCRGQLMMVYQHHERLDGSGYPVGCGADEIHEWARICAVCDVFEALTSNRPYRPGMKIADAFKIMDRSAVAGFDKDIYACWKRMIPSS